MIGQVVSHYRIIKKLGGGGMGVVYKAQDVKLERFVALKFLPEEVRADEIRKERFIHEAKAASAFDHPNICSILEIDETPDGQLFIAMAYCEGETLKKKLNSGKLPLESAINIAIQIAQGLAETHDHDIIHRDIKPANIMLVGDDLVKIVDFGLAKVTGETELTQTGTTLGTVAYMSPEQAQGKPVDHRTDIWSWGVVLYEMVTGRLPFPHDNQLALLNSILTHDPQPASAFRPDLPKELETVIEKALAKNRDNRYDSMRDALNSLQRLQRSYHRSAPPESYLESAQTLSEYTATPKVEKRQLTILISRISGYTDLVEQLNSEMLDKLLLRFRDVAKEVVTKYGGVINEFSGDEMMIVFGILAAGEEDFVFAVRAALQLHESIREVCGGLPDSICRQIGIQSGIHGGVVVMQSSFRPNQKYGVAGRPIDIAGALAAHAELQEVLVSQESRRLIGHLFEMEPRDSIVLKGKLQSITPFRVVGESGIQSRLEGVEKATLTAYTGRDKELKKLQDCLQTAAQGEGQFITIVGEAGSGKSRLLYEFRHLLDPVRFRILQGRSHSFARTVPYYPFTEVLMEGLQLHEKDPETTSVRTAAARIQEVDPALEDFLPIYLHLLSLQSGEYPFPKHLQGEELRLAVQDALSAFVFTTKHRPVVFLLEDWQSADDGSQRVLNQMLDMVSGFPALVIVTYRPERSFDWIATGQHTSIYLAPLEVSSSREIIKSVLKVQSLPEHIVGLIHEQTGGNPFFLEEICQTLVEEGTLKVENQKAILSGSLEKHRLPDSVQAVIRSRLDRMDRDTKKVLHHASVVGREFTRGILQRITDGETTLANSLTNLKNLGLIQQTRVLPEPAYKFKHALTQEVAYESLLVHERKQLHELVGEAIEELYGDRLEEHLNLLAHHFSRSENWDKAVHYGTQSARKTSDLGQFSEALEMLEKTGEWLSKLPDGSKKQTKVIDLLLQQERLCETLGIRDRQEQILNDLLAALKLSGDKTRQLEVYRREGELFTLLGRFDEAENILMKSLHLSRSLADRAAERNALRSIGFLNWRQGRNQESVTNNEKALAIDREAGDVEALASDLTNLGNVLHHLGNYGRALECLQEALKIYETLHSPVQHAAAYHMAANIYRDKGDNDQALDYIKRALDISTRNRLVVMQSFHMTSIANMYWQEGKVQESLELHKEAVEVNRKSRYADGLAHSLRMVGETLQSLGKHSDALHYLEEAASLFAQLKDPENETLMWRKIGSSVNSIGILEWKSGDFERALHRYERALAIFRRLNDEIHTGLMLNSIGVTLKSLKLVDKAVAVLKEAVEVNRKTNQRLLEAHALSALGEIYSELGQNETALKHFAASLQIRREIGDNTGEGWMLYHLARLNTSLDTLQAAEQLAQAESLAAAQGDQKLLDACKQLQEALNTKQGGNHA